MYYNCYPSKNSLKCTLNCFVKVYCLVLLQKKGWNLSVNNGITAGTEVQPGGYVNFNGDEGNIIVSATKEFFGPSVYVKLSRDLNVDSIHAGEFFK